MSTLTVPANSISKMTIAALEQLPATAEEKALLEAVINKFKTGEVTLMNSTDLLTPNKCAQLLGISRAHFNKVLDSGTLPYRIVGERDRRIAVSDFKQYQEHTEKARRIAAFNAAHAEDLYFDLIEEM